MILAIDPGTKQSAWLVYRADTKVILDCGIHDNERVRLLPSDATLGRFFGRLWVVLEWVESFGMPVGQDVFHTVRWIGRFEEAFGGAELVTRREVKLYLCNSARAKDTNVRRALMDKFPATGGGVTPRVGTKKHPGPLYGIKSHLWSALAVAVTYAETRHLDS